MSLELDKQHLLCTEPQDAKNKTKSCTFCIVPWIHMHIMPDSSVIPCCVAPYDDHFGMAKDKDLKDVWNNKRFKNLRLDMLNGKKTPTCEHCYQLDESGLKSMRTDMNARFAKEFDKIVIQTNDDGSVDDLNMKYFDVRFSNICNFKCRGCSPVLSSSWYEDYEQLFDVKPDAPKIINCTEGGKNDLWNQLTKLIPTITEAYFAGGEPLMMDEHYKTLEILLENNRSDAILSYNTNLSIIRYKKYDLIDLWSKFRDVYLSVSIDDIGPRGEYFRKGQDWQKTLKNWTTIKDQLDNVHFQVTCTVNIMNVYYLADIVDYFISRKLLRMQDFLFNMLLDPDEYRIQVLPVKFKTKVKNKLLKSLIKYKETLPEADYLSYYSKVQAVIDFLEKQDQSYNLENFQKRTQKMDMVRGDDFKSTYPELSELIP